MPQKYVDALEDAPEIVANPQTGTRGDVRWDIDEEVVKRVTFVSNLLEQEMSAMSGLFEKYAKDMDDFDGEIVKDEDVDSQAGGGDLNDAAATAATTADPEPERAGLYKKYFDRYDLDNSGHLNSQEELAQLSVNLVVRVRDIRTTSVG